MGRDLGRYLGDMGSKVYVSGDSFIKNMAKDDLNQSPLSPNEHELSQVPPSSHCVVPHLNSDLHLLRDPHVHVPDNGRVHDPPLVPNLTPHTDGGDAFRL